MPSRTGQFRAVAFVTSCLTASCAEALPRSGSPDGWTATDSAGVRIVENWRPEWTDETAWTLAETPRVSIGGGWDDTTQHLSAPIDAVRLPDERIVIADLGDAVMAFYDDTGRLLMRAGRDGEGPGEFRAIWKVERWIGDSIVAFDLRLQRYSIFDKDGTFGRLYRLPTLPGFTLARPMGLFADGAALVPTIPKVNDERTEGWTRPERPLLRVAPDAHEPIRIPAVMAHERYYVEIKDDPLPWIGAPVLFAHDHVAAALGDIVVAGTTDRAAFEMIDRTGRLTQIVRIHQEPIPITAAARERAEELLVGQATRGGTINGLRRAVDNMPERKVFPAFGRWAWEHAPSNDPPPAWFRDDTDGNVWVLSFEPPGTVNRRWMVISPSGRWLGHVRMPPGFEPLDIGNDYVLGWRKDDLDVVRIELYELRKTGSAISRQPPARSTRSEDTAGALAKAPREVRP